MLELDEHVILQLLSLSSLPFPFLCYFLFSLSLFLSINYCICNDRNVSERALPFRFECLSAPMLMCPLRFWHRLFSFTLLWLFHVSLLSDNYCPRHFLMRDSPSLWRMWVLLSPPLLSLSLSLSLTFTHLLQSAHMTRALSSYSMKQRDLVVNSTPKKRSGVWREQDTPTTSSYSSASSSQIFSRYPNDETRRRDSLDRYRFDTQC